MTDGGFKHKSDIQPQDNSNVVPLAFKTLKKLNNQLFFFNEKLEWEEPLPNSPKIVRFFVR